jgi:hypothetical protein
LDTIERAANCYRNLLSSIGLEIMYPADAERLRRAHVGLSKPAPADVGLIAPAGVGSN